MQPARCMCARVSLSDTTQAALSGAPDAMATTTLHCIQGGSGLVTTAAPHMYELHPLVDMCARVSLSDTTQAALSGAPDAIAAATLHCIPGGSGLVTTAAPHMYELHSWPMQGSPYSAELHALSTFKPHFWIDRMNTR